MNIQAEAVTLDDGPPITIGFADHAETPDHYLLLQYDPSEQDGLYLEINDQQCSGYNLVQRIQLADEAVTIELTSRGQQTLKIDSRIVIVISPQATGWELSKRRIGQILNGIIPVEAQL